MEFKLKDNNRSKFIKYHCSSPIGCSLQLTLSLASCSLTPVLCLCSLTTSMNLFHAPFPSWLAPLYSTRLLLNIVECVKLTENQRNHLLSVSQCVVADMLLVSALATRWEPCIT